jgi:hypothetical protein
MIVSSDTFQAIIASIRCDPKAGGARDKRTEPRVGFTGVVAITMCGPGCDRKPTLAKIRDLSTGGIGILHHEPIPVGQQFLLCLKAKGASPASAILCTVARIKCVDEGLYIIGARFTKELEDKIRNAILS